MKKYLSFLICFILLGEFMIRFDKRFELLKKNRVVEIATSITSTPEYKLLQDGSFNFPPEDLKIMVLGDSYIHGGGIEFKDNFSQNLKRMINAEKSRFNQCWVLDVSRSSSNNLDNHNTYFEYVNRFNPDIVIVGYNNNDVDGRLEKGQDSISHTAITRKKASGQEATSLIRKIYRTIYKSEFIHFICHETHSKLKANGVILPGSRFDQMLKCYSQEKARWKRSKELWTETILHAADRNIEIIIYHFPEINLIEHPGLFIKSNKAVCDFFNAFPNVKYINGCEHFMQKKSEEYRLSKYDGHPNEKAHKLVAERVLTAIKEMHQ